jgi:hypothetical protein
MNEDDPVTSAETPQKPLTMTTPAVHETPSADDVTGVGFASDVIEGLDSSEIPWLASKRQRAISDGLILPNYNPVEVLLTKLERFLVLQPEWAVILAAPRKTRRQAISLVAKRLLTIPDRYTSF